MRRALKASVRADSGHVAVVLEARESRGEGGDRFRLQVLDDGPGVPADELARIAERSVRGEAARTRHPDGKGLGLAIVRRVCELHAMSLTFANADEGGLVVTIEGPERGRFRPHRGAEIQTLTS